MQHRWAQKEVHGTHVYRAHEGGCVVDLVPPEVDVRQECEGKWLFWKVVLGSTLEWENETKKGRPPTHCRCIDEHVTTVGTWAPSYWIPESRGKGGIHPLTPVCRW